MFKYKNSLYTKQTDSPIHYTQSSQQTKNAPKGSSSTYIDMVELCCTTNRTPKQHSISRIQPIDLQAWVTKYEKIKLMV